LGVAVVGIAGTEEVQVEVRSLYLRMTGRDLVVVLVAAHILISKSSRTLGAVLAGSDTSRLAEHCVVAVEDCCSRYCWIVDAVARGPNLKLAVHRP
jgi:hypothetical protein